MARPVFIKYMKRIEADSDIGFDTDVSFSDPPPGFGDLSDCSRYKQIDPQEERDVRLDQKESLDEFDDIEFDEFDIEENLPEVDTSQHNYLK